MEDHDDRVDGPSYYSPEFSPSSRGGDPSRRRVRVPFWNETSNGKTIPRSTNRYQDTNSEVGRDENRTRRNKTV